MEWDIVTTLIVISTVLGILLSISELLAWSSCDSNSIWQCCCGQCMPRSKVSPDVERPAVLYEIDPLQTSLDVRSNHCGIP